MHELVLISNKQEATIFKTIGFLVHIVRDEEEIEEVMRELSKNVVLIAFDTVFADYFNILKEKQKAIYPLYIPIPFTDEDSGKALLDVKENIRKSIGIDLL
ncbi:MAG TPA: V-type ATP synthase subunit F [Bacilli bacterium]|nr:V-type ATP synthase subunit F [Bacilli bacterium]